MLNQAFSPENLRLFISENIKEMANPHLNAGVRRNLADDNFRWFAMLIETERPPQTHNSRQMAA